MQPQEDGLPLRTHLERLQRQRAELPPGWPSLEGPPLPAECVYIWRWYLELSARRRAGFSGAEAISWQDMKAWAALQDLELTPFELECLGQIEGAYFRAREKQKAEPRQRRKAK